MQQCAKFCKNAQKQNKIVQTCAKNCMQNQKNGTAGKN